jgi:hypothetical protein
MLNDDPKPALTSRAVWGGVVAILAGGAGLLGYAVSPEDAGALTDLISSGAAVIGGMLAIIGRIRATRRIG